MSSEQAIITLVAAAAFLAIAVLAALRRARNPLATQLGLLSVGLFTYNALDAVAAWTDQPQWDRLGYAAAALTAIPTFKLVIGFVGQARRLRWASRLLACYFFGVALATAAPTGAVGWHELPGSPAWAVLMLAGVVPGFGLAGYLLVSHTRRAVADERARGQLLLGAILLGPGSVAVDLATMAGGHNLTLSPAGLAIAALLLAALVLRARLLEGVTFLTIVNAGIAAALATVAQILVFSFAGTRSALLIVGSLAVVLALMAALRPLLKTLAEQRARLKYLATLGRFAQQMAHDLRNPVAAIRGAAQFLQQERAEGRSMDPHLAFVDLIVERTERLERVISSYQRMGRVEPLFSSEDVNSLLRGVLEGQRLSSGGVTVQAQLAADLPACEVDADLLAYALENLVRNAVEAMGAAGGQLTASTEHRPAPGEAGGQLIIRISDTGSGMDPRTKERAFDEFFTTKTEGSGLGLPFVGRVAQAHGGVIRVRSRLGQGTSFELQLPVRQPGRPSAGGS